MRCFDGLILLLVFCALVIYNAVPLYTLYTMVYYIKDNITEETTS